MIDVAKWTFLGLYFFLEMPTIVSQLQECVTANILLTLDRVDKRYGNHELRMGCLTAARVKQMLVLCLGGIDYFVIVRSDLAQLPCKSH